MKKAICVALAAVLLSAGPALAEESQPTFDEIYAGIDKGDPNDVCGVVMCMSSGKSAPHQCMKHVENYFEVRVYKKKKFRPAQTAEKRKKEVLDKCEGASDSDKLTIHAMFGTLEHNPFSFY